MQVSDLIRPADEHNTKLISNVHPLDWKNPSPSGKYNLVVIGAGTAGLVTAAGSAGLGAKVALIERHMMGGDCLNVGCVPSKAVIRSARAAHEVSCGQEFGLENTEKVTSNFAAAWERMRRLRAKISPHDSVERFSKLGIDVFIGEARFKDENTVEVAGTEIKFAKAVIASGARASSPEIEGLQEVGYLDNETVFELTEQPMSLAVIGGGPIGCELAQTFQRLGTKVTILEHNMQFLPREDPDASKLLANQFESDGLVVKLGISVSKVEQVGDLKRLHFNEDGSPQYIDVEEILVGVGRKPNIEQLNLDAVGVQSTAHGVEVNDFLETTNPKIYAAGDVCMKWKFTHAADFAARNVIQNALFAIGPFGKKKLSDLVIPWCTYTEPEIAHVGLYPREAKEQGIEIDTYQKNFCDVDRSILEGDEQGFVKVHVRKGSDKIVGATIAGTHAGDMIGELAVALTQGIGLGTLSKVIHPYPTTAEAIRQTGDLYNKTKLTPLVKKIFSFILAAKR